MPILRYDNKEFATITNQEAEEINNHKGMHLNFKGNLLKMTKVEVFKGEQEDIKIWQKTTEELKEIVGEFETQLKNHTENIPLTLAGKKRAVVDGKLPDCGIYYLEDRGIAVWYLENGWLSTEKKENEKRTWSLTQKYISDGIPQKEEALEELRSRRAFAEEEAIKNGDPVISGIYYKERSEKIAGLRKVLAEKLGWVL